MLTRTKLLTSIALAVSLAGCDLPRDPEDTTATVRGGTLIVGVSTDEEPSDPKERAAIERLAERLDAKVEYRSDEIHRQVEALKEGEIQLLAGHIPETTPFASEIGTTAPVSSMELGGERVKTVFALRKGENRFLVETEKAMGAAQ